MLEYKIYKSPWKVIKPILLCLLFVLLGIFILNRPDPPTVLAWLTILLCGLALLVGLFHLLDRRPQIIINEAGIFYRTTRKHFVNWEIIQDAYVAEVHSQKFICLVVDQQSKPSTLIGKLLKRMAVFSKALGFQKLNIPLVYAKVDAERLTNFILAMRTADRPNRETILQEALLHQL